VAKCISIYETWITWMTWIHMIEQFFGDGWWYPLVN
jgi:hypothetical protein